MRQSPGDPDVLHEITAARSFLGQSKAALESATQLSQIPGYEARGFVQIGILERDLEKRFPDPSAEIVMYCGGGYRSALAFLCARRAGITQVRNFADGWSVWSTRYTQDATAGGVSPGWRQEPSGRPVAVGATKP